MGLEEIKQKIKKEIIKSGFPLEIFCKNKILESKWGVSSKNYFLTSEGNYREIDITSHISSSYKHKEEEIHLHSMLIVECKKNKENPWVFFKDDLTPTINVCSNIENIGHYLLMNFSRLVKEHHFNTATNWIQTYVVPFKNEESREGRQIYDSISKLIEHFKYYQNVKKKYKIPHKYIQLCYLTIVFDGLMFMANTSGENVDLQEIKHTGVAVCQFESQQFYHYSIEIINKDNFADYLTKLRRDHFVMENFLKGLHSKI